MGTSRSFRGTCACTAKVLQALMLFVLGMIMALLMSLARRLQMPRLLSSCRQHIRRMKAWIACLRGSHVRIQRLRSSADAELQDLVLYSYDDGEHYYCCGGLDVQVPSLAPFGAPPLLIRSAVLHAPPYATVLGMPFKEMLQAAMGPARGTLCFSAVVELMIGQRQGQCHVVLEDRAGQPHCLHGTVQDVLRRIEDLLDSEPSWPRVLLKGSR